MKTLNGLSDHSHRSTKLDLSIPPKVAILLSTYNGERFLVEQLDSLTSQSHSNWVIYASDDGSRDSTLAILQHYQSTLGPERLTILPGPRQGFAKNFLSLAKNPAVQADYFAFCDQDDIWHPERLSEGIRTLQSLPPEQPALFCSRTRLIDEKGTEIGHSPLFRKPTSFKNAIVQSIAGGNTMLFNAAARQLLACTNAQQIVVSHDWWLYILVSGCGGAVHYSPYPLVDYRQHGRNLIGSNSSLKDRIVRIGKIFRGTFSDWNAKNLFGLNTFKDRLCPESREAFEQFQECRQARLIRRMKLMCASGLYRQTTAGQLGLIFATLIKRI